MIDFKSVGFLGLLGIIVIIAFCLHVKNYMDDADLTDKASELTLSPISKQVIGEVNDNLGSSAKNATNGGMEAINILTEAERITEPLEKSEQICEATDSCKDKKIK